MEIAQLSRFSAAQREGKRVWRFRSDGCLSMIRPGFDYEQIVLDVLRVQP